jgi:RimJ/RimL family protein N-acetyltransferase
MGWFHFRPAYDDPQNCRTIELGYRLKPAFWGQGFATEGSKALIERGFQELGVDEVVATTMKNNIASRRVMEKAGLRFVEEFVDARFPGTTELDVRYALRRDAS